MLAWDNIAVKRIMIRTNSKINSHQSCYLHLTANVQPLNVVRLRMWLGAQCKLLHNFSTCQVVAAPSINDDSVRTLLDHTLGLKQSVVLILFSLLHLCTQHSALPQGSHSVQCVPFQCAPHFCCAPHLPLHC